MSSTHLDYNLAIRPPSVPPFSSSAPTTPFDQSFGRAAPAPARFPPSPSAAPFNQYPNVEQGFYTSSEHYKRASIAGESAFQPYPYPPNANLRRTNSTTHRASLSSTFSFHENSGVPLPTQSGIGENHQSPDSDYLQRQRRSSMSGAGAKLLGGESPDAADGHWKSIDLKEEKRRRNAESSQRHRDKKKVLDKERQVRVEQLQARVTQLETELMQCQAAVASGSFKSILDRMNSEIAALRSENHALKARISSMEEERGNEPYQEAIYPNTLPQHGLYYNGTPPSPLSAGHSNTFPHPSYPSQTRSLQPLTNSFAIPPPKRPFSTSPTSVPGYAQHESYMYSSFRSPSPR